MDYYIIVSGLCPPEAEQRLLHDLEHKAAAKAKGRHVQLVSHSAQLLLPERTLYLSCVFSYQPR